MRRKGKILAQVDRHVVGDDEYDRIKGDAVYSGYEIDEETDMLLVRKPGKSPVQRKPKARFF